MKRFKIGMLTGLFAGAVMLTSIANADISTRENCHNEAEVAYSAAVANQNGTSVKQFYTKYGVPPTATLKYIIESAHERPRVMEDYEQKVDARHFANEIFHICMIAE